VSDQQPDATAAAAPVRVATYDYANHGPDSSLAEDRRRNVLAEYIAARPSWHLVADYRDHAHPGRTRPGLTAVLADAQAGRFDVLLVASIDRLGRLLGDLAAVVDQLTRCGVHVVAADSAFDTSTRVGQFMATILAVFGEYDRHTAEQRGDSQPGGDVIMWRLPSSDARLVHNALCGAVRRWEETTTEAAAGAQRPPQPEPEPEPQPLGAAGATINVEPTPRGYRGIATIAADQAAIHRRLADALHPLIEAAEGGDQPDPPLGIFTVVGVWLDDRPVPVGVIDAAHQVAGGDTDAFPEGLWVTCVPADDAIHAQRLAVAQMADNHP
jgi:hypothetical protein